MLELLTPKRDIREAQENLEARLKSTLARIGHRNVGYPSGNHDYEIYAAGPGQMYWGLSKPADHHPIRRYVNSFGIYRAEGSLEITVEISVPEQGDDGRVQGMFARDPVDGAVYLLHSGKVGGGTAGVSGSGFRSFLGPQLETVQGQGRQRSGILLGNVKDPRLPALIWNYVEQAAAFKRAVRSGSRDLSGAEQEPLPDEVWGRRQGRRGGELDYVSYHGLVYRALKDWVQPNLGAEQRASRTSLIDLGVWRGERLDEVFEIKTEASRQSFYTGLGQLVTHAAEPRTKMTLVMPQGAEIPADCLNALKRNDVRLLRYSLHGEGLDVSVKIR